ncbi:hypothetical protein AFLA_009541 [Aspergillus flavus NRRL3357]|nr:hypothetical protein AFLA_009541 [Aspergillus flavus NRRL3357]
MFLTTPDSRARSVPKSWRFDRESYMTSICFIKFIVMENSYYVLYSLCISPSTSLPIYPVYKVRNLSQSQQRKSLGEKFLSNHGLYPSFSLTALLQHIYYAPNPDYLMPSPFTPFGLVL